MARFLPHAVDVVAIPRSLADTAGLDRSHRGPTFYMSSDLLEVPSEVNEALALVRENRVRLEATMGASNKFDSKHSAAAGALAQAVKALSTEARLWAAQLTEKAGRATPEQRTQAALQHLAALPDGTRLGAYRRLVELEAANTRPVPIVIQ